MRQLLVMVVSDLSQRIRDASVIIFAIVVPLTLIFVMNLVFSGVSSQDLKPVTVAVSVPEGDQLAAAVPAALGQVSGDGLDVTVKQVDAQEAKSLVDSGVAGMAVVVPQGFMADLLAGDGPQVRVIEGEGVGLEGAIVTSVVNGVLAQLSADTEALDAGRQAGLGQQELAALRGAVETSGSTVSWTQGTAADEQLSPQAALVAGQAGLFLLFTVGFGVLGLVQERENGTLARLLSMPMRPELVVIAKGLVSFILGLVATGILLTAGTLLFDKVDFGPLPVVALLVVMVVLATTAIMFVIAKVARTAEQAGIAQAIVAIVLGMSGGAFFPVTNTGAVGALLQLNPVGAFTRGLGITSGGGGVVDLGSVSVTLLAFTAVCLLLAWLLPGRKDAL
ncbi:MAG: ABC transporter permease [Ornithinimicrobium sp.]|uniref:ABC transporter permease n=1 Tax=Ornithinimicrobium sp. TaxID=1977084 RepID=UPI0026DFEC2D|nr:ABC transporter permease [Ornithinimicrobium sp.]MDO5740153.1 ABC transporter permease [Ornithinimicrobium sp.]